MAKAVPERNRKPRVDKHVLTPKQIIAIDKYFELNFNKQDALLAAGYSERTARGNPGAIFDAPQVVAEIERRQLKLQKRHTVTMDRLIEEYAHIAFARYGDILEIDQSTGTAWLDMRKATPEILAAIAEFATDEYKEGRGEDGAVVMKMKVKLHDKKAALDSLTRIMGGFNDKLKVEGEVSLVDRLQRGRERARLVGTTEVLP